MEGHTVDSGSDKSAEGASSSSSADPFACCRTRRCRVITTWVIVFAFLACIVVFASLGLMTKLVLSIKVEKGNPVHLTYLYLALLSLSVPTPIPGLMASLVTFGGYYFGYYSFIAIAASFPVSVPINYFIGVYFRRRYGGVEEWGAACECCLHKYLAVMRALGNSFGRTPIRLTALMMWGPLPAQLEPFLMAVATPVSAWIVILCAVPSKILQGFLFASIGAQASSLRDGLAGSSPLQIAAGLGLTAVVLILIITLGYYVRRELANIMDDDADNEAQNQLRAIELKIRQGSSRRPSLAAHNATMSTETRDTDGASEVKSDAKNDSSGENVPLQHSSV